MTDNKPEVIKLVSIEAKNIMKLKAVYVKPGGQHVITVGGRNSQGKSTVLRLIEMLFGGKGALPEQPIREGEKKAHIIGDFDGMTITRTFRGGGNNTRTTLTVENKDGAVFKSPQTMLDKMVGKLSFDPLEFSRMKDDRQAQMLRELVGVDTRKLDEQRETLYEHRAGINKEVKRLEGHVESMPHHEGVPGEEISISAVMQDLEMAETYHKTQEEMEKRHATTAQTIFDDNEELAEDIRILERLQIKIDETKKSIRHLTAENESHEHAITQHKEKLPEIEPIKERLRTAEEVNRQVRENAAIEVQKLDLASKQKASKKLTGDIKEIDEDKAALLESAEFPMDGISFEGDGITFNGLPFSQASTSDQLKTSVAMGFAMNPALKVITIKEGSLLDSDNLAMISQMAAEQDALILLEMVSTGDEVSIIIEDGEIQESADE